MTSSMGLAVEDSILDAQNSSDSSCKDVSIIGNNSLPLGAIDYEGVST